MSNRQAAYKVVRRLRKEGYQALFAGGCVRDRLLGRPASDYDVVTDAVPDAVIKLFRRTLKIGAKFGVVLVLIDAKQVEVATFRTEGGYQDGRHPDYVAFASAKEDAARRDFTVNGMFYDPIDKKVLDFVNGQSDLQKRILRTIGQPDHRFSEDYLRMLRAVRLAVKLDFSIETGTWEAIKKHAGSIRSISAERIAMEIEQILTHPRRAVGVRLLAESGLVYPIFDQLTPESAEFGAAVLEHLPKAVDFPLALASFLAGLPAKTAAAQAAGLKLSSDRIRHIRFLSEKQGLLSDAQLPLSQLKLLMHQPYFWDLAELEKAIALAKGLSLESLKANRRRAMELDQREIHPAPLLNGHELMALGIAPGPAVGRLASEMYIAQLEGHIKTKEQARQWCQQQLAKYLAE
ncbi:MAG TPA: CCA tRNA nucleotidyltransferase [Anaerohalosphaeraceae bacterium]|nr:CCA tRNA nucleotidyltransferase [Anaerohalosphaeraceae bacterium]HOL30681.1 CCA tRNA nucleotidyltransferase [Anaerohalosphaeraceae bacterium]HOM76467.1 CCA tRNA nucleotidyltransferase [Anaerohalosphaeraceae bacterium]HPC63413.1 CCA tRNA nucleotidyltransferase [Anaerohalosphaeraceae bacterium]HPO70697.1 CCA tRNA nucleotidyltransferase [Anaerohalosphaeraceae bacterium]